MLFRQSLSLSHGSSLTKMPLLEGHFIDTHLSKLQGRKYFIIVCHTQTGKWAVELRMFIQLMYVQYKLP